MITLGMLLSKLLSGNPAIVVMSTENMKAGIPWEPTGIKMGKVEDKDVIILTI